VLQVRDLPPQSHGAVLTTVMKLNIIELLRRTT
jgi:hypothetical protein